MSKEKISYMGLIDGPEGPMSMKHPIYLNKEYTIIYKSDKKPKRKLIRKIDGLNLLMGIDNFESIFSQLVKNNPTNKLEDLKRHHRETTMGLVETWGRQKLGLKIQHPMVNKEMNRGVKKEKLEFMTLIYGYFGYKFSYENQKSEDKHFSTIELLEYIPTDERIKGYDPQPSKEQIESIKKYGCNTWSFS